MSRFSCRTWSTVLLVVLLPGCSSWRVQSAAPQQFVADHSPGAVRLKLKDERTLTIVEPRVVTDSLVGTDNGRPRAVALADVSSIAVRRFDFPATLILLLGVLGATLAIAVGSQGGPGS